MAFFGGAKERLEFLITANPDAAIKAFEKTARAADKELGRTEEQLDQMANRMVGGGAMMVGAAAVAGRALWGLGTAAGDLGESVNAVNVAFGEAGEGVLELSDNAARAVGLSRTEFNSLATSFAGAGRSIAQVMQTDVVGVVEEVTTRAADLASVFNIDVTDSMGAIQSAIMGQFEPAMNRFGITMSAAEVEAYALANGIAESGSAMSESEKQAARYGLLMEKTGFAAGDFANTSDSLANSSKVLKAELADVAAEVGEGVLPVMTTAVGVVGDVVGVLSAMPDGAKQAVGAVATIGTVALGTAGTVSMVAGQLVKMRDRFWSAASAANNFSGSLTMAGKAAAGLGVVGIAVTAASIAYGAYNRNKQEAVQLTEEFVQALRQEKDGHQNAVAELIASTIATEEFARAQEALGIETKDIVAFIMGEQVPALEALSQETGFDSEAISRNAGIARSEFVGFRDTINNLTTAYADATAAEARRIEQLGEVEQALDDASTATDDHAEAQRRAELQTQQSTTQVRNNVDAVNALRQAHQDLTDSQRPAWNAEYNLVRQRERAREAIESQAERLKELEEGTDAYNLVVFETTDELIKLAEAEVEAASRRAEAAGQALTDKEKHQLFLETIQGMVAYLDGPAAEALQDFLDGFPPPLTHVEIVASMDISGVEAEERRFNRIRENISKPINVPVRASGGGGSMMAFARGTNYAPGGVALVGEEGPELVHLPTGSKVDSAATTKRRGSQAAAGDTYNINVHLPVGSDPYAVQRATERWARRNGRAT